MIRSGGGADKLVSVPADRNDPLTITAEAAVSDRLGAERRKSSTETRRYGLAVRPRRRSRNKPPPRTPGRAFLIGSGGGQIHGYASACGCGDGVPVYVSGFSGQPMCDFRCDIVRRTVGQL